MKYSKPVWVAEVVIYETSTGAVSRIAALRASAQSDNRMKVGGANDPTVLGEEWTVLWQGSAQKGDYKEEKYAGRVNRFAPKPFDVGAQTRVLICGHLLSLG